MSKNHGQKIKEKICAETKEFFGFIFHAPDNTDDPVPRKIWDDINLFLSIGAFLAIALLASVITKFLQGFYGIIAFGAAGCLLYGLWLYIETVKHETTVLYATCTSANKLEGHFNNSKYEYVFQQKESTETFTIQSYQNNKFDELTGYALIFKGANTKPSSAAIIRGYKIEK